MLYIKYESSGPWDHPGIIPNECGKSPISGSRVEAIWSFPYIIQCKIVTPRPSSILTPGA